MTSQSPRFNFTLGIKHETALPVPFDPDVRSPGSFSMRGHSVGGYGSVTTNKVIATIAGEVFGMDVQAYPKYGSEKKGLPTTYYLTIAKDHIRVHSELENVEFIPLNDVNAFNLENPLAGLTQNGMVFVQSQKTDPAEVWAAVPAWAQKELVAKNARLLALDTVAIAREVSSLADLQQRMQGIVLLGVFPEGDAVPEGTRHQRGSSVQGRGEIPAKVFRKARRAGRAGQPEGRSSRLSRSVRNSARSHVWLCAEPGKQN